MVINKRKWHLALFMYFISFCSVTFAQTNDSVKQVESQKQALEKQAELELEIEKTNASIDELEAAIAEFEKKTRLCKKLSSSINEPRDNNEESSIEVKKAELKQVENDLDELIEQATGIDSNPSEQSNENDENNKNEKQYKFKLIQNIQSRYALFLSTDASDSPIVESKSKILEEVKEKCKEIDVEQCQYVVFKNGYNNSESIAAFGELRKDKNAKTIDFKDLSNSTNKELWTDLLNNVILGYHIFYIRLMETYNANEVIADEDFKNCDFILEDAPIDNISKDDLGSPYIQTIFGRWGIQVKLDIKDPFLRLIKKGDFVDVRVHSAGFMDNVVMLEGKIVAFNKNKHSYRLIKGKAMEINEQHLKN